MKTGKQKKKLMVNKITICRLNASEMEAALAGWCPPPTIRPGTNCVSDLCPDTSDPTKTVQ